MRGVDSFYLMLERNDLQTSDVCKHYPDIATRIQAELHNDLTEENA